MGRPKAFNPSEVLNQAMLIFWSRGYGGTSVADLEKQLGINKFSLYSEFGNKHALYLKALDLYVSTRFQMMLSCLQAEPLGLENIQRFFQVLQAVTHTQEQMDGCFLVNAGIEMSPSDIQVRDRVSKVYRALEDGFYQCVRQAQLGGKIAEDQDAMAIARGLVIQTQGLLTVARNEQHTRTTDSSIQLILGWLDR